MQDTIEAMTDFLILDKQNVKAFREAFLEKLLEEQTINPENRVPIYALIVYGQLNETKPTSLDFGVVINKIGDDLVCKPGIAIQMIQSFRNYYRKLTKKIQSLYGN